MSVIVTDTGFSPDDWTSDVTPLAAAGPGVAAVDIPGDADPFALPAHIDRAALIRVAFAKSADGRGFTIASALRRRGYTGRLRAAGHVLADQYAMARRCGFDEVEIDDTLAARQPEAQWRARADWREHDYHSRLRG